MDPTYPLYPILAFLAFVLVLIPLPWHFQAWNSGTCFYIFWTALACLNQFVNSIVWHKNALNPAPIWCDISIRIMLGASVGIPAASLCINRRLYHIANARVVRTSHSDKLRSIIVDSFICLLFPAIFIALQYVVQGHRFDVIEDIGCYPALYNTLLTYFLSSMWPIVIGMISAVYCVLSLKSFAKRRLEFSQFLSSNKSLTIGRYFRLMALAATDIVLTTPLAAFTIWLNATAQPLGPWRSWADTHFAFSRVEQIPAVLWRSNYLLVVAFELTRWIVPFCAFVFFGFFGFASEARKNYVHTLSWLATPFRRNKHPLHFHETKRPILALGSQPSTPSQLSCSRPLPPYSPPCSSLALDEKESRHSLTSSLGETV